MWSFSSINHACHGVRKNIRHGHLPFLAKDIHNISNKLHQMNEKSDAMDLLHHYKCAKNENANFQYAFKLDEERRLE